MKKSCLSYEPRTSSGEFDIDTYCGSLLIQKNRIPQIPECVYEWHFCVPTMVAWRVCARFRQSWSIQRGSGCLRTGRLAPHSLHSDMLVTPPPTIVFRFHASLGARERESHTEKNNHFYGYCPRGLPGWLQSTRWNIFQALLEFREIIA